MPTYEYRCPDGHAFERRAKISEAAAELPCPVCGKLATRQISGGAGFVFKGSGFYLTDYGKNAHRKPGPEAASGESSTTEAKAGDKSAETKSADSKPADSKAADSSAPAKRDGNKGGSAAATPSTTPSKKSDN